MGRESQRESRRSGLAGKIAAWSHTHLELENILDAVEFLLVSVSTMLPSAIDAHLKGPSAQLTPIDIRVEL